MNRVRRLAPYAWGALMGWLGYCAAVSARNGAFTIAVVFTVGGALAVLGHVQHCGLEDALRREAVRAERDARPQPADLSDQAVAVALAGWCCDAWAATAGADHDPATCTRKDTHT